jgi:RNA polymerase-binding transcription factor DksA
MRAVGAPAGFCPRGPFTREAIMTGLQLQAYRGRLQKLAVRLGGNVTELQCEACQPVAGIAEGGTASEMAREADPPAEAAAEDVALALLGVEAGVLAEVTAALGRIDAGTFGTCERCGRAIAKARLDALPYARMCFRCGKQDRDTRLG